MEILRGSPEHLHLLLDVMRYKFAESGDLDTAASKIWADHHQQVNEFGTCPVIPDPESTEMDLLEWAREFGTGTVPTRYGLMVIANWRPDEARIVIGEQGSVSVIPFPQAIRGRGHR